WRLHLGVLVQVHYIVCICMCIIQLGISGIHVQNMQVCYVGIHVPWWFAAPINPSSKLNSEFVTV
uniref:Uncharacterized protein n=1 Tax=Macaca fascicularis TaxID=9541 RepID=A0A7N9C8S2_MACFA